MNNTYYFQVDIGQIVVIPGQRCANLDSYLVEGGGCGSCPPLNPFGSPESTTTVDPATAGPPPVSYTIP